MKNPSPELYDLLAKYPEAVQTCFENSRAWLLQLVSDLQEEVDIAGKLVGYGLGAGYKGNVCALLLSQKGIKLGINRATELPDPHGLLEGTGKVHKYVVIPPHGPADIVGLPELLEVAVKRCKERLGIL